jgi:hypothetical protein
MKYSQSSCCLPTTWELEGLFFWERNSCRWWKGHRHVGQRALSWAHQTKAAYVQCNWWASLSGSAILRKVYRFTCLSTSLQMAVGMVLWKHKESVWQSSGCIHIDTQLWIIHQKKPTWGRVVLMKVRKQEVARFLVFCSYMLKNYFICPRTQLWALSSFLSSTWPSFLVIFSPKNLYLSSWWTF